MSAPKPTPLAEQLREARDRLKEARESCGDDARLVGYDVNGIQDYVTANSRPVAMAGASALIKGFDEYVREKHKAPFTGGGRGMLLVPARDAATIERTLRETFQKNTIVGELAVASVPFRGSDEADALRWLKLRLQLAKDEAPAPRADAPTSEATRCTRCRRYEARYDVSAGGDQERVCERCEETTRRGRDHNRDNEQTGSLVDIVPGHEGFVAALSADGNNMGTFFDALHSLDEVVDASTAIAWIFENAHTHALDVAKATKPIAPVTGGDDIRVFFEPHCVAPYVGALVSRLVELAETSANALKLHPEAMKCFRKLGVGIGVVCASKTSSATSMLHMAHALEREAKRHCLAEQVRAAVDFRRVTKGGVFLTDSRFENAKHRKPVTLHPANEWTAFCAQTRALARVPKSQRAVLSTRDQTTAEEFANAFRYQVARSRPWQAWYEELNFDWRDADQVIAKVPDARHLDLLHMIPEERS